MAIDFEAIRRKLGQLSGQNSKRNMMWRPPEGEESTIRIIAFPDNDGQPFQERWFYYNIGNNPGLLTPHQFGKPDPIQELINKLRSDGSKEAYEMAKKLYPKMRTYAAVVVRGEEDKGVRLYAFGKTVYQSLLNIMLDEDYGDITDIKSGRDIKVICTKQPGRQWAMTEVRPRGKSTPLTSDKSQAKEWLNNIPNLDDMYETKSYDELEKIVNDWLNSDGEDDDDSTVSVSKTTPESKSTGDQNSKSSKSYKDIDAAFSDLEEDLGF